MTATVYCEAIGLSEIWPIQDHAPDELDAEGFCNWAKSYYVAATALYRLSGKLDDQMFEAGPLANSLGLAAELSLKGFLRGCGKSDADLKRYRHNTYQAYLDAREHFDEVKFINLVFTNTETLRIPDEVHARLSARGEEQPEVRWRVFFDHLRILDSSYDAPYRTRYLTPGPISLPEPAIILVGLKIILNAMAERLDVSLLPNS